ncbi:MAG: hypothetical protein ACRCWP_03495 [Shewanella sp.]
MQQRSTRGMQITLSLDAKGAANEHKTALTLHGRQDEIVTEW